MLKVSVSQKNGMNTVKIIAENSFVTSALAQNENYLQKLFNDQGMNLDFTAQNESQSFGSKSSFSQNSNEQHKNKKNGPDEKINQINDKNDVVGSEDDSSRHMINVIA
jgi:flagellar hook-length control protein FliK